MNTNPIRHWDPTKGDALQGDVILFKLPDNFQFDRSKPIEPRATRLILAEGEVTGHHHAIDLMEREVEQAPPISLDETNAMLQSALKQKAGIATMYTDPKAIEKLVRDGELTVTNLAIGLLVVEGGPVVLRHDEHDPIRIPPGKYYVGGQREWNAAEERRVKD